MYKSETIKCPLCGADNTHLVFKNKDYLFNTVSEPFNVVQCNECSIVYVNPRPSEDTIHEYYKEDYYQTGISPDALMDEKKEQLTLKYKYLKDLKPGKMLDVGCQKGEFMYYMKNLGWQVRGMDFSNKPPNLFNLDITYSDSVSKAGFKDDEFDLVTLWGVLEHVYHPREMLCDVSKVLRQGGSVLTLVTNFNSLPASLMRHDDIPRHTTLFTAETIKNMFERTGFETEFIKFNARLFGGTHRGFLNYCVKRLAGEKIEDIVEVNRTQGRWSEFSSMLRGRKSSLMQFVDRADINMCPLIDTVADFLGRGFIMIARGRKK